MKTINNHVYVNENNGNALICYVDFCHPHYHWITAINYIPVSDSVWKLKTRLLVYCGWNWNNFKTSMHIRLNKLHFVDIVQFFVGVFEHLQLVLCYWRLVFCSAAKQNNKMNIKMVVLLHNHHGCSSMWRNAGIFDFTGFMLTTYVNNVNHDNYINNITILLINYILTKEFKRIL